MMDGTPRFWIAALVLASLGACTERGASDAPMWADLPTRDPVEVSLDGCPALEENAGAAVLHDALLQEKPQTAYPTDIWLRKVRFPQVPRCQGRAAEDRKTGCAERDDVLAQRVDLSVQQMRCIARGGLNLEALVPEQPEPVPWAATDMIPTFWEDPYHYADGDVVPILRAATFNLTRELVQQLARHPYVDHVEAAAGTLPLLGIEGPPPAAPECPQERQPDRVAAKLAGASALRGAGRQSVSIELIRDGYLPAPAECPESDPAPFCLAYAERELERYILATRAYTCVRKELDAVVAPHDFDLSFGGLTGSPLTPKLPPWYVTPGTPIEFGFALTWEEAERVAAHPYVASIRWLGSGRPGVVSGCPDIAQPPPEPECTEARESTAGKWSQRDEAIWSMAPGPHQVSIMVRGAGQLCAVECPPRSNTCPEKDELLRYVEEWNARSQRCVRALVDMVGGSATDERFFLVNMISATLSWAQIQAVAAHPHVELVEADGGENVTLPRPDAGVVQPSDDCEKPVNVLGNEVFYAEQPEAEQPFRGLFTFRPSSGSAGGRIHEFFLEEIPVLSGGSTTDPPFLERIGKYVVIQGKQLDLGYGPEIMAATISACK